MISLSIIFSSKIIPGLVLVCMSLYKFICQIVFLFIYLHVAINYIRKKEMKSFNNILYIFLCFRNQINGKKSGLKRIIF